MQTEDRLIGDSTAVLLRAGIFVAALVAVIAYPGHDNPARLILMMLIGGAIYVLLSTFSLLAVLRNPYDQRAHTMLVCLDVLAISALIWMTGTKNSMFALLYYIPVLYAATRLDFRSCIASSMLSAAAYAFVSLGRDMLPENLMQVCSFAFSSLTLAAILGMLYSELFARKRLAESLRASLQRLSAIYDVARAAWDTSYSLEEIVMRVLQEVSELAHSHDCYLALLDGEGRFEVTLYEGAESEFSWEAALRVAKQQQKKNALLETSVSQNGPGQRHILTLALRASRELLGVAQIHRKEPFLAREEETLQALCTEVAVAIENAILRKELLRLATTDAMTRLYNRAELSNRLSAEMSRAQRYGRTLSLLMLDIDGFKQINDRAGHAEGDRVLQLLADLLRSQLRPCDSAGRWGGDEFCILLPETPLEGSLCVAERIRTTFRTALEESTGTYDPELAETICAASLSIGIISSSDSSLSSEQLLSFADRALYAAKRAGRNQVKAFLVGADTWPPPPPDELGVAEPSAADDTAVTVAQQG